MASAADGSPKRDNFVDYARLGLALSVCLYHTRATYHLWPQGYSVVWAVPAFLALSGWYVLHSYEWSATWREFIRKRVVRVVPAFVASLALVASMVSVWPTLISYGSLGLIQPKGWTNIPVWSFSVEEVAYGLLAVLFVIGAYRRVWPICIAFALWVARPGYDDHFGFGHGARHEGGGGRLYCSRTAAAEI